MKANGPKNERETIIRYNEDEEHADIWTASNSTYKKLRNAGYEPIEDNQRSAVFRIPKNCVSLRKSKAISEKRRKALEQARSRVRPRSEQNGLSVQ